MILLESIDFFRLRDFRKKKRLSYKYSSPRMRKKFEKLNEVEKIRFIYGYLCKVAPNKDKDTLKKFATIFGSAMYGTSLPFGTYPEIIDESYNPFIKIVKSFNSLYDYASIKVTASNLINVLYGLPVNDNNEIDYSTLETDTSSEFYLIEREIIYFFGDSETKYSNFSGNSDNNNYSVRKLTGVKNANEKDIAYLKEKIAEEKKKIYNFSWENILLDTVEIIEKIAFILIVGVPTIIIISIFVGSIN